MREREVKVVTADVRGEKRCRDRWKDKSREAQKSCGERGDTNGAFEKRTHPAEEKSPERAEALVEVNIAAAGFREGGAKFRVAECAEEHDEPATIQAAKTKPTEPTVRAMSLLTRKTPVPIVSPITMATADQACQAADEVRWLRLRDRRGTR